jgi:Ca2+-binding EF-hand superfamily protein
LDTDETGNIDYNEFVAGALDPKLIFTSENMDRCFNFFDIDNSGFISIDEFLDIFKLNDEEKFENELKTIPEFQNKDELDRYEFEKIIKKMINM